jgi:uncharacterized membrane protein (DUF485 family)
LPLALGIILILLIVWLPIALSSPVAANIIPVGVVAILLIVLPALMVWLAYRR